MLIISIPSDNLNERKYVIDIIFKEFLKIEFCYKIGTSNYEITLENKNKLIFEDHFFCNYPKDLDYLKLENLPSKVEYAHNDFIIESDIPIIYGDATIDINNSKLIVCGIDIFASIYFMISRWEEYVNTKRDNHNRFSAKESISYKNKFIDRAIVNEYIEMLWNMLLYLGFIESRCDKRNEICLTHDIDNLYQWKNWQQVTRVAIGDVLKRKNISLAAQRFSKYFLIKRNHISDPYDTFDWLMDKSDTINVKSRFYFMSGGATKYDNRYKIDEPKCLKLVDKIKQRGHIIGFHSSYSANVNLEQFKEEKQALEEVTDVEIIEGRGHYLRFEVPTTWQVWEDAGMKIDSTCGYAEKEGFRCGTGDQFSVFNILTRKKLKLKERPLILMDCSLFSYQKLDLNKIKEDVHKLMKNTKTFTILWHNSQINHMHIYQQLVNVIVNKI